MKLAWKETLCSYDDRRDIMIPGSFSETITFCAEHFISLAQASIESHGAFFVTLSGGSTPKSIFELLASPKYSKNVEWGKVKLFWSDERCVPPSNKESNYHMAMEAGFATLPILKENIFRMPADSKNLEEAAQDYEKLIVDLVPGKSFDLVMLGMGEDGHTASLFPTTHGLHAEDRLVVANFIPQKNVWRMTLTFECINNSQQIAIYVLGKNKTSMIKHVLTSPYDPDHLPIQRVGTRLHKALWIVDKQAASELF
jgi:6-phosphogluconolactonase